MFHIDISVINVRLACVMSNTMYILHVLQQVGVDDKDYLRRRIKSITGVDFHSNRQLTRLACKIIGTHVF